MITMRQLVPLLLAGLGGLAIGADTPPLTLADAVTASREAHPDASVAAARLLEAQARLRQANAALLPQIAARSSYTVTDRPDMAFISLINHRAYTPAIDANNPPVVDNLNMGVDARVPIYTPGVWSGRAAARSGTAAAQAGQEAVRQGLTFATVQAFIGVHQAQAHVTAARSMLTAMEANVATARNRHQAGQLSKADLLGLEAHAAAARSRVAAAAGGLDLAGQALATAMGRSGSITAVAPMPALTAPAAVAGEKPELAAVREQVAAAASAVTQAQAQHLPRLGAFGGYGYDRGFKQDGDGDGWHVGVGLEWNLFAGGATRAGVAEAEAKRSAAEAELRRTTLAIEQGRAAARTRHATATSQLTAVQAQLAAAEEADRLQAERFAAGAATASDLAVADATLAQARAAVADAEAAQRLAIAELRWQYGAEIVP